MLVSLLVTMETPVNVTDPNGSKPGQIVSSDGSSVWPGLTRTLVKFWRFCWSLCVAVGPEDAQGARSDGADGGK